MTGQAGVNEFHGGVRQYTFGLGGGADEFVQNWICSALPVAILMSPGPTPRAWVWVEGAAGTVHPSRSTREVTAARLEELATIGRPDRRVHCGRHVTGIPHLRPARHRSR